MGKITLKLIYQRLFPAPEVRIILSAYQEEARNIRNAENGSITGKEFGLSLINSHIVNVIRSSTGAAKEAIGKGKSPRILALRIMKNLSALHISSGQYHTYRGLLSMRGAALRSLWEYSSSELETLGDLTKEGRLEETTRLAQEIKEVG